MAPLILELDKHPEIEIKICLTAQHREMLDPVMALFGLAADYDLDIMEPSQSLGTITTKALDGLASVLEAAGPDLVLVHGDTTTTFSGALAAFYQKIPVGHVEAGLRSRDRYSPYPEEMNRRLTGQIATLHFAPTAENAENLRLEGILGDIFVTGNTVIDAMSYTVGANSLGSPALDNIDFENRRVITLTCHRRENYGVPMEEIMLAARDILAQFPDTVLVYPVHLSPYVQETARRILGKTPRVCLTEPLDPLQMHNLMARSYLVLTDSGGIQEEAPALGKPVLVLRRETERPEAVAAGTVKLAGIRRADITALAAELLTDPAAYEKMATAKSPYGDGAASRRIAQAILYAFGRRDTAPEPFG